jgi:CRISPR system Cascade subunit CasD
MPHYIILRLEGPMQAWGCEAVDPRRPSGAFPRRSALAGLIGNALGWKHRDTDRLNRLQDALRFAAREDRAPERIWDYQTADLSQLSGFGRWGPTSPGGAFKDSTHLLRKEYLADAHFTVAIGLDPAFGDVKLEELSAALSRPARPLFLGRKSCPPASPLVRDVVGASGPVDALARVPVDGGVVPGQKRIWFNEDHATHSTGDRTEESWQRRNYRTARFDTMERIVERRIEVAASEV